MELGNKEQLVSSNGNTGDTSGVRTQAIRQAMEMLPPQERLNKPFYMREVPEPREDTMEVSAEDVGDDAPWFSKSLVELSEKHPEVERLILEHIHLQAKWDRLNQIILTGSDALRDAPKEQAPAEALLLVQKLAGFLFAMR